MSTLRHSHPCQSVRGRMCVCGCVSVSASQPVRPPVCLSVFMFVFQSAFVWFCNIYWLPFQPVKQKSQQHNLKSYFTKKWNKIKHLNVQQLHGCALVVANFLSWADSRRRLCRLWVWLSVRPNNNVKTKMTANKIDQHKEATQTVVEIKIRLRFLPFPFMKISWE